MKLSEAIREGAKRKPQGFGPTGDHAAAMENAPLERPILVLGLPIVDSLA